MHVKCKSFKWTKLIFRIAHCCNRISYFAWTSNNDHVAGVVGVYARDLVYIPRRLAYENNNRELPASSRSLMPVLNEILDKDDEKDKDNSARTASWDQIIRPEDGVHLSDIDWEKKNQPISAPTYSLLDVPRWASDFHRSGEKNEFWDFAHITFKDVIDEAYGNWYKTYGTTGTKRSPYEWHGTEDEALGHELGSDEPEESEKWLEARKAVSKSYDTAAGKRSGVIKVRPEILRRLVKV
jgi:hypothetical protein